MEVPMTQRSLLLATFCAALATSCGNNSAGPYDATADQTFIGQDGTSEVTLPDGGGIPCTTGEQCAPLGLLCDLTDGLCKDAPCEAGVTSCWDTSSIMVCAQDALSFQTQACPAGEACSNGLCAKLVCTPGTQTCSEGKMVTCNTSGTSQAVLPCPENRQCLAGQCRPILHNVVILFDTSSSMNDCIDQDLQPYYDCCPAGCPEEWPVCETYQNPLSKLGYSKRVFQDFFKSDSGGAGARYALLSFPQEPAPGHSFCFSGYWYDRNSIEGDDSTHAVQPGGWFDQNMSQVVKVPLATTWDAPNVPDLARWLDYVEEPGVNPELRASGFTPLGKSIFYAGEYIRLHVLVEGKPCTADADCGSQDYFCSNGKCHDPVASCRQTLLLVFTDGGESDYTSVEEFFNPVVQARRLKFGLGCDTDADCLGGAGCLGGFCQRFPQYSNPCTDEADCAPAEYCVNGVCTKPGFEWPTDSGVCAKAGFGCSLAKPECPDFLEQCKPVDGKVSDSLDSNVVRGWDGKPLEITTHVIDVSQTPEVSKMIAEHGGGRHFSVDLAKTDVLLNVLYKMTDIKYGVECMEPQP